MKIFKSFIFGLMAAATLGGFVSCQDDIDAPEPIAPVAENLDKVNTTIFDFKKEYWQDDQNYCKQVGTKPDGEHIYIKGRVISSDESGTTFRWAGLMNIRMDCRPLSCRLNSSRLTWRTTVCPNPPR